MKHFYKILVVTIVCTVSHHTARPHTQTYSDGNLSCLIQKLFLSEETLQFIFDDADSHKLFLNMTNPRIVTQINKPIIDGLNAYNNYVIYSGNQTTINTTLTKLKQSYLWNESQSPRGKFLIITSEYVTIQNLVDTFSKYDTVRFSLIQQYSVLNGHKNGFNLHEDTYQIRYISNPKIKIRGIKLILPFPVNISTSNVLDLKAVFELALNGLNIIGNILKVETSYVFTNNTKSLVYSEGEDMYIYLSMIRDVQLYKDYDVSDYFFKDSMVWAVPIPDKISTIKTIVTTLDPKVWLIIITTLIVQSSLWWLFTKLFEKQTGLVNYEICIFNNFAVALGNPSYLLPKTASLQVLLLFYLFYSMEISTIFQGKLFSGLTHPGSERGITTIKELADSHLPMIGTKITKRLLLEYFSNHSIFSKVLKKLIIQETIDKGNLEKIARFKNCSTILGKSLLIYIFPQFKPKVYLIERDTGLLEFEMSLALRKGHYMLKDLNRLSRRITESGIYLKLFSDITAPYRKQGIKNEEQAFILRIRHLNGFFILWLMGLSLSIFIFIVEISLYP